MTIDSKQKRANQLKLGRKARFHNLVTEREAEIIKPIISAKLKGLRKSS